MRQINNNYYNWDISKGDYKRDSECTSSFERAVKRELIRKKILKVSGLAGLVILIITAFAYWLFK